MFAYPCPFCTQRLLASPERVGQRTICPKCLKPIVIPAADSAAVASEPPIVETFDEPFVELLPNYNALNDLRDDSGDSGDAFAPLDGEPTNVKTPMPQRPPSRADVHLPKAAFDTPTPTPARAYPGYSGTPARAYAGLATAPPPAPVAAIGGIGGLGSYGAKTAAAQATLENGIVTFNPTPAESADIAAELTAALTMRMKPPPEPPSDLRLSTGLWIILTAVGFSLWLFSTMYQPMMRDYVALIGVVELVISYAWVVYLSGRREPNKGVLALLPPVWLYRLFTPTWDQRYRPLRFALSGAALLALYFLSDSLRPTVQAMMGVSETPPPTIVLTAETPLTRLFDAERQGSVQVLADAMTELAAGTATFTTSPIETQRLIAEFRRHRATSDRGEVKAAALTALVKWAGPEASKADLLNTLTDKAGEKEREAALKLAPLWKDAEVTRAVAARLGSREDWKRASDALKAIGPPEAEDALLALFENEDVENEVPPLLAEIGGAKTMTTLKALAEATKSPATRKRALQTIAEIEKRLADRR